MRSTPCSDRSRDHLWYGPDILDMIQGAKVVQEIGSHSFGHPHFGRSVEYPGGGRGRPRCMHRRRSRQGHQAGRFVFPNNSEGHHELLQERGFRAYRGRGPEELRLEGCPRRCSIPGEFGHPNRRSQAARREACRDAARPVGHPGVDAHAHGPPEAEHTPCPSTPGSGRHLGSPPHWFRVSPLDPSLELADEAPSPHLTLLATSSKISRATAMPAISGSRRWGRWQTGYRSGLARQAEHFSRHRARKWLSARGQRRDQAYRTHLLSRAQAHAHGAQTGHRRDERLGSWRSPVANDVALHASRTHSRAPSSPRDRLTRALGTSWRKLIR